MSKRKKSEAGSRKFGETFFRQRTSMAIEVDWTHLARRGRNLFESVEEIETTVRTGQVDWEKSQEFPERPYDPWRSAELTHFCSRMLTHRSTGQKGRNARQANFGLECPEVACYHGYSWSGQPNRWRAPSAHIEEFAEQLAPRVYCNNSAF
jgi:hypothetical protein